MAISIAELHGAGIRFEANEAVAIAQQLISSLRDRNAPDQAEPPYGPPSAANVFLNQDGSVVCRGCSTTPTVSEIGIFLDELLIVGSPRVPGAVRYTIARALLNVDVPPFDSLDDFSRDLARHERGDRAGAVRRVLARAGLGGARVPLSAVERRSSRASATTTLRRELREADAQLFQRHEGMNGNPPLIDLVAMTPPVAPARGRTWRAAAACLAAGASLITAGEFVHSRHAPIAVSQTAPIMPSATLVPATLVPATIAREKRRTNLERGIIVVHDAVPRPVRVSRREVRRVSVKRPPSTGAMSRRTSGSRSNSRHLLDRLKLGWLRTAFTADR